MRTFLRRAGILAGIVAVLVVGQGSALAAPSIVRLRQSSATGLEDYLYTAGNTIFAQAQADPGKYYRFRVSEPGSVAGGVYTPGPVHLDTGCRAVPSNKVISATYTLAGSDPQSGQYPWQFRLDEFATSACSGNPAATNSKYFDNAKLVAYSDTGLVFPRAAFMAGATVYSQVVGAGNVNKGNPTASQASASGSWSTTWILPSLLTACKNTGGGDRAGNTAAGVIPAAGATPPSSLQYAPGATGDAWNRLANYDNAGPCPALGAANEGQWKLQVKRDNTHFVTLPAFTVDATPPDTTVGGAPSEGATVGVSTATFTLTSTEPDGSFECSLDGAAFTSCTSPVTLSGLSDAAHTFQARAIDLAGNVDATPAVRHWTVDTNRPHVTLTTPVAATPSVALNDATPALAGQAGNAATDQPTVTVNIWAGSDTSGAPVRTFSADRAGTAAWSVGDSDWASQSQAPLPDGTYTVQASQSDTVGPATTEAHTFIVDTSAPTPTLTTPLPGSYTNDPQPKLAGGAGTAALDNSTLTVKIYNGAGTSGSVVQTLSGVEGSSGRWSAVPGALADGVYTAQASQSDSAGNVGTSGAHTFTVDTAAPATTLTGGMSGNTGSTSATFTFAASESGSTFECSLDGGPFSACSSPKSYADLAGGSHTFQARAIDRAGNVDPNPPTANWTINTSLPDVTLVKPASGSATNDTTPTFTGDAGTNAGDSSAVTVKLYQLGSPALVESLNATRSADDGAWSVDAAPALPEGTYVAHAEQTGSAGTAVSTDHVFTVDTTAPDTQLTQLPQSTTSATSATFTFGSSDGGTRFECSLDGAAFSACTSPATVSGLSNGQHTFSVRSIDAAGNVDPTPTSQVWTVDTTLPAVTITTPAGNAAVATGNPEIDGTASADPSAASTINVDIYALQSGQPLGAPLQTRATTRAGDGSWSLHALGLAEGDYVAFARQVSPSGTGVSAGVPFSVDLTPPITEITAAPQGSTTATTATIRFRSNESGSTFKCSLNGAPFTDCTSPQSLTGLADGDYTFAVEAIDRAGNVDIDPDTAEWTVDTATALPISITTPTDGSVLSSATPVFTGTATKPAGSSGVAVEIFDTDGNSISTYGPVTVANGGGWTTSGVVSPDALPDGDYTAVAEQNDSTGTQSNSAPIGFTVDTAAPVPTLDVPASGLVTTDHEPAFSGTAGTDPGDDDTVTVFVYGGTSASGTPLQTLTGVPVTDGSWTAKPATLADGTYTVRVQQQDSANHTGLSNRRTFTVQTPAASGQDQTPPATDGSVTTAPASPAPAQPSTSTAPVTSSTAPQLPTGGAETADADELVLAVRIGGCTIRVKTLRRVGLAKRRNRMRFALQSNKACSVNLLAQITLKKANRRTRTKALVVRTTRAKAKLAAGKERILTLRFSRKVLKQLKAAIAAKKTLLATVSLTGATVSHKPGTRRLAVRIQR